LNPQDWVTDKLGYNFSNLALLEQALTHKSASVGHNERLEFLGDAILGSVVASALYRQRPDADEGTLSRLRALLVRGETLAAAARELDLGQQVYLGTGETRSGGHQRGSILANTLEALFGAVYLDGGFDAAVEVIIKVLGNRLSELPVAADLRDPKTRLQELMQAKGFPPPEYVVEKTSGAPHDRTFVVLCRLESLSLDVAGVGTSRRRAEQSAAERVLEQLDNDE